MHLDCCLSRSQPPHQYRHLSFRLIRRWEVRSILTFGYNKYKIRCRNNNRKNKHIFTGAMRFFSCLALLASAIFIDIAYAHSQKRAPLNYLSLLDNPEIHNPSHRVNAYSEFDLTFSLHKNQQRIRLSLEPNHDILDATGAFVEYVDKEGRVTRTEQISRHEHKIFMGKAYTLDVKGDWHHTGWARINIRRDGVDPLFEGAFSIRGDHHHIHMKSGYMQTKHELDPVLEEHDDEYMVVFRDSDYSQLPQTSLGKRSVSKQCSADSLEFNTNPNHPLFQTTVVKRSDGAWGSMPFSSLFEKRQNNDGNDLPGGGNSAGVNLRSTIGQTTGCPTTRKVALIGVATDCSYTGTFNSTDSVRQNIITQINSASDLYQSTFNITLGLRNLTVSEAACPGTAPASAPWNVPCSSSSTITDRLNLFSTWRGQRGDNNAYWTLLTNCNTGAEVGLAWLGQLCQSGTTTGQDTSSSGQQVSGANVVARTNQEWQVIAHESGHTFGAVHDCDSSTCANSQLVSASQCCPYSANGCDAGGQYIMNPSSSPGLTQFSPCTVGNICSAILRNVVNTQCLSDNKGVTTISGNQCGNGIVEANEDCDCGGPSGCGSNSCCNPTTCKFKTGAVCDPSNEGCCTSQCQFASSGVVCRASTGVCDPAETCTGTNGTCPADATAPNGQSCGSSGGLQCASGQCTSRDQQCRTLMGSYTQNNDTYACNSQGCAVSCGAPEFGPNVCYSMQQNFLDGTICGGGGRCANGVCKGSSAGGEIKSWIGDNKGLVIGIAAAVGGLILLGLLGCLWRRCRRGPKKTGRNRKMRGGPQHTGGWNGPMPPPMSNRGNSWNQANQGGWQQPAMSPHEGWQPSAPAPSYGGWQGGGGHPSVRYA